MPKKVTNGADYGNDYVDENSAYSKIMSKRPWYAYIFVIFLFLTMVFLPLSFFILIKFSGLFMFLPIITAFLALFTYSYAEYKWVKDIEKWMEGKEEK